MSKLSALSLFTGAGGLDFGFEAAGFETRVAVELDPICCISLRASRPEWPVIEGDLLATSTRQILQLSGLKQGEPDVLIGGPPCQPFSKSGWWSKGDSLRLDDPRANTLTGFLRVLKETRPRAFLLENVEGLKFEGKDEGLRLLLSALGHINTEVGTHYVPTVVTLNAADFGVPQTRTRVFVIASRNGRQFKPPAPRYFDPEQPTLLGGGPWRTAWDAIGGMKPPQGEDLAVSGKWADLLPTIPEGQNYLWHTDRSGGIPLFGWRRRYWSFLLKLAKNRPAWTIQAQPGPATGPFHWESRRLSTDELARLQTFPSSAQIKGTPRDVQRQLGNAVPSLLAEVLANEIRRQFFDLPPAAGTPVLLPEKRPGTPGPEPVARVPRKYLDLAGRHAPHPGTGKGFLYERPAPDQSIPTSEIEVEFAEREGG